MSKQPIGEVATATQVDGNGQGGLKVPLVNAQPEQPQKRIVELVPQYIFATSGIIYAAGFLVVLSFLDRFGIREPGTDFWKLRYIHIEILCLAFPIILNGTIFALSHLILR